MASRKQVKPAFDYFKFLANTDIEVDDALLKKCVAINPFTITTKCRYVLCQDSDVLLQFFTILGQGNIPVRLDPSTRKLTYLNFKGFILDTSDVQNLAVDMYCDPKISGLVWFSTRKHKDAPMLKGYSMKKNVDYYGDYRPGYYNRKMNSARRHGIFISSKARLGAVRVDIHPPRGYMSREKLFAGAKSGYHFALLPGDQSVALVGYPKPRVDLAPEPIDFDAESLSNKVPLAINDLLIAQEDKLNPLYEENYNQFNDVLSPRELFEDSDSFSDLSTIDNIAFQDDGLTFELADSSV